ncbi:MAG: hypothetical protein KDD61_07745 [Bdellovibrionales bacterium]|nr:hypothetical protein [Bdellovibrionales bacterium]
MFKWLLLSLVLIVNPTLTLAEELSATALFYRCYAQITQTRPDRTSSLLAKVRNGQTNPIAACMSVLDSAQFNNNHVISNTGNSEAKNVLRTFHNLHASWFQTKQFPENFTFLQNRSTYQVHDNSVPALYITRSLFETSVPIDYIFKTTENLVANRTTNNPNSMQGVNKSEYPFPASDFRFASNGDLLGVSITGPRNWSYSYVNRNNKSFSGTVNAAANLGGGVLGSQPYLLLTVDEDATFKSDGAVEMPRKWARNFISDFLCRDLPLIRPNDGDAFIAPNSDVEFRKASSCIRCHATMDRMASTLRNLNFNAIAGQNSLTPSMGLVVAQEFPQNKGAESGWPAIEDKDYAHRPTRGTLFFRNYKGELINQPVTSVSDLGLKLSQQDDPYICLASRYYRYFTGISTNVGDIGDTSLGYSLSKGDLERRNLVIQLGLELKGHKNLRTLIQRILNLPHYQQSDFSAYSERGLAGE